MRYTCLRHQGTGAFYHFAPKPTGVLPGPDKNRDTFCFFFVQAKKKKKEMRITELNRLITKQSSNTLLSYTL